MLGNVTLANVEDEELRVRNGNNGDVVAYGIAGREENGKEEGEGEQTGGKSS